MKKDDLFKDYVSVPASPGFAGLYHGDGDDGGIFYLGEVVAWHTDPTSEQADAWPVTEDGHAHYVVNPYGKVTKTSDRSWNTVTEFLDKNLVEERTAAFLKKRFKDWL